MRGIERRRLERLLETVHVDQDVAAALREKIADLARRPARPRQDASRQYRLRRARNGSRQGHQLRPGDGHPQCALRPEPGFVRPPFTGLRGRDEQCRFCGA